MPAPVRPARPEISSIPLDIVHCTPSAAPTPETASGSADERRFRVLVERWRAAVRDRDPRRLGRLHLPDGILQAPDGTPARGPRDVRERWAEWFARPGFSLSIEDLEIQLYPGAGVGVGNGTYRLSTSGRGRRRPDRGRILLVGVRSGGHWGIRFNALFSEVYLRELSSLQRMAS